MNRQALLNLINESQLKKSVADVRPGETVRVHSKIREGNKERVQIFEGLVTGAHGGRSLQASFTVRKVVSGIGVERTFPLHSPWIVKIERVKSGKVRRAKLNFVREYALSSKFKLKDKGKAGSVWEDIVEQQAAIAAVNAEPDGATETAEEPVALTSVEPEKTETGSTEAVDEVAEGNEKADNTGNGTSAPTAEKTESPASEPVSPPAEKASDSPTEPTN